MSLDRGCLIVAPCLMDERKYPLMSDLNFDTMELTFTTTTNAVLARAAQEANGLNNTPVDPAHILLAMTSLTSDFSVYKPLRELDFDYDDTLLQMGEYSRMGTFTYQRRMSPLYDEALRSAAYAASLRHGARMIGLGDLLVGIFAGNSPLVLDLMKQRGVTRNTAMVAIGAPDEFILRFIDVPSE